MLFKRSVSETDSVGFLHGGCLLHLVFGTFRHISEMACTFILFKCALGPLIIVNQGSLNHLPKEFTSQNPTIERSI